ncbi:MAG: protein kinase, partial [Candidatus Eisenbacteria bacterium]|nr:protein kinase [Candidatus Eisenbacteria bacterium]
MPESDSPDFQTRIGPYSILGELGRGGMGVVYRAHDPRLERDIALKILPGEFAAQPWRRDRFLQEARLLATLNHPNISTVHSLEESNGLHFLTMELVPGVMLAERIEEGSIGIDDALSIGRQIARALEAAHARGVIHRDLKPRNIMLTPDGTVKVLDFGLARSLSELDGKEVPETSKGSPGSVDISSNDLGLGTPGYMSPEQIFDEKVGTGTDIWAFGCVLMEVLTGSIVFGGETAWERIHSTMIDVDLDRLPVETPPPLRGLIQRCLNRDPVERPPSMGDARHELEELIEARRLSVLLARLKRATSPHPTNLPHRVTSFIGREREISAVTGALVPGRLVTLTGAGGCGKTRLAIEVAERRLPDHGDGVWLIEFGALSRPELATGAVVSALGLTGDPTRPPLDLLRDHLVTSNALLVLDNCEHLLEACGDLVAGLLATCPGLHILATSREALRVPGEQLFAVPTLSVPPSASLASSEDSGESEAVRLFVDRARLVRPDFQLTAGNAEAVNKICRRLDGIPLALELAAARAQSLSAEEIAQRLDRRFQLLTGGPRTMPRHQTLRALIDWSYEQLEDKEQAVLRRLSVFPGSWTLGAAEAVCAGERIADWEVVDLFCRLVDKSLVEHDADASASSGKARYRMLETVRTYARDRLSEAGEEPDAWRRHRRYFSSLALEAEPHFAGSEQGTWFTRPETDLDNIRAALAACMDDEAGIEMGLVMAAALREFWEVRGHWSEARQIFQRLLAHPMTRDRLSHARGLALSAAAHMAWYQSELDQAHVLNEECLTIARQILDEPLMARALSGLAILASDRGQYERARSLYEECLSIRR